MGIRGRFGVAIGLFLRISFTFTYVCVPMCIGALGDQKMALDLQLQVVTSCLIQVLGAEVQTSVRARNAINC